MFTYLPRRRTHLNTAARLRRLIAALAAVTCGLLGWAGAVPGASASIIPVPDGAYGPAPRTPGGTVHVIAVSGMPGWQITFIAVAAALAASAVAVARKGVIRPLPRPWPAGRTCW